MPDDVFRWVVAVGVILACLAFVLQAGVVLAIYRAIRRTQSKVMPLVDSAHPILETTHKILEENRPHISEISAQAVAMAKTAREQAAEIGELVRETSLRARTRIAQIDEKVDDTVEKAEQVGDAMKTVVMKPMREVNALMAGLKAAIAAYASGRRPSVDHATQDEEMFI
jgi:methyl-accepting chemotaxis protein